MFKKIPNFLNSAPTSIDSALRLLSAPSVRFWQQTAICPVSLWELVVELHTLNWARAQAVRRISDKVTLKELEERVRACARARVCEILLQTCKHFTETFQLLNQAYGEDCMSRTQCHEWFKRFNWAECRSVKIPGLEELPHQQTMTMSTEFVLWFMEIGV